MSWRLCLLALSGCFDFGASRIVARPRINATAPLDGAENVTVTSSVEVVFSKVMDKAFTELVAEPAIAATPMWDQGDTRCSLQLTSPLTPNTRYVVTVTGRDSTGVAFVPQTFAFTTLALSINTPIIVSTAPQGGSVNVALDTAFVITFSLPMDDVGITTTPAVTWGEQTWDEEQKVLTLAKGETPLAEGTLYTIGVTGANSEGTPLGGNTTFSFTTLSVPDLKRPEISTRSPADGSTFVPRNSTISVGFSEAMDTGTITLAITAAGGAAVPCPPTVEALSVSCDPGGLPGVTNISVAIGPGAKDLAGNLITGALAHSFSTSNSNDSEAPTLLSVSPPDGSNYQPRSLSFDFTFSEPMDEAATVAALSVSGIASVVDVNWYGSGPTRHLHYQGVSDDFGTLVQWQFAPSGAKDLAGIPVQQVLQGSARVRYRVLTMIYAPIAQTGHCNGAGGQQSCYQPDLLYVGDYSDNVLMRSLFLFNLADLGIPVGATGVVFQDASLRAYLEGCSSNASQLGSMIVQGVTYGPTLSVSDYGLASDGYLGEPSPNSTAVGGHYYYNAAAKLAADWERPDRQAGFRMQVMKKFMNLYWYDAESDDDAFGDYCNYGTGRGTNTHPPRLSVEAYYP